MNDMKAHIQKNQVGGDFMSPDASDKARLYILRGRTLLYANKGEAMKHAILDGKDFADGAAHIVAMIIAGLMQKMGPLNGDDLKMVVMHLAGTIVEAAKKMGAPSLANDQMAGQAVRAVIQKTAALLQQMGQGRQAPPPSMQAQQGPMPDQPPAGMQQPPDAPDAQQEQPQPLMGAMQ